jgi:hypothetical protein
MKLMYVVRQEKYFISCTFTYNLHRRRMYVVR